MDEVLEIWGNILRPIFQSFYKNIKHFHSNLVLKYLVLFFWKITSHIFYSYAFSYPDVSHLYSTKTWSGNPVTTKRKKKSFILQVFFDLKLTFLLMLVYIFQSFYKNFHKNFHSNLVIKYLVLFFWKISSHIFYNYAFPYPYVSHLYIVQKPELEIRSLQKGKRWSAFYRFSLT